MSTLGSPHSPRNMTSVLTRVEAEVTAMIERINRSSTSSNNWNDSIRRSVESRSNWNNCTRGKIGAKSLTETDEDVQIDSGSGSISVNWAKPLTERDENVQSEVVSNEIAQIVVVKSRGVTPGCRGCSSPTVINPTLLRWVHSVRSGWDNLRFGRLEVLRRRRLEECLEPIM